MTFILTDRALSEPFLVIPSSYHDEELNAGLLASAKSTALDNLTDVFKINDNELQGNFPCGHRKSQADLLSCVTCVKGLNDVIHARCSVNLAAFESMREEKIPTKQSLDRLLKPGFTFIIANDLEVSTSSSIAAIDILRRHLPSGSGSGWSHLVALQVDVSTDDFRAIARSALAGRACVLNDALGAKAAEKFASGHFAPPSSSSPTAGPPPLGKPANPVQDGGAGSDESYDIDIFD